MRPLRLWWIDTFSENPARGPLLAALQNAGGELRVRREGLPDDDGAIVFGDAKHVASKALSEFRQWKRPVVFLDPTAAVDPVDLAITALEGLVTQVSPEEDASVFDASLIALLRSRWREDPQRYAPWLVRALTTAAIGRLESARSLEWLEEASHVGPPPEELDTETIPALIEPLRAHEGADSARLEGVQRWLLYARNEKKGHK